jgi:hypothetical protein
LGRDETEIEDVEDPKGFWWYEVCEKPFDEPNYRTFPRMGCCPYCRTIAVEWIELRPEPVVPQVEPSGAELLQEQALERIAAGVNALTPNQTRPALTQRRYPPEPFEGLRGFVSIPGAIIRKREAKTARRPTLNPAPQPSSTIEYSHPPV